MDAQQLIDRHPEAFHVTQGGAWESIRRDGLLSTSALLDRFGVSERDDIECRPRPGNVELNGIVIRDNKPLRLHILERRLDEGLTVADWCRLLNGRVFLWATEQRARRHLAARGHRDAPRDLIVFDTARLVERHHDDITLCAFNSGSTLYPNAPARGRASFAAIDHFAGREVAEICVARAIPDVEPLVRRIERIDSPVC